MGSEFEECLAGDFFVGDLVEQDVDIRGCILGKDRFCEDQRVVESGGFIVCDEKDQVGPVDEAHLRVIKVAGHVDDVVVEMLGEVIGGCAERGEIRIFEGGEIDGSGFTGEEPDAGETRCEGFPGVGSVPGEIADGVGWSSAEGDMGGWSAEIGVEVGDFVVAVGELDSEVGGD